jgi:hypothetical protein
MIGAIVAMLNKDAKGRIAEGANGKPISIAPSPAPVTIRT